MILAALAGFALTATAHANDLEAHYGAVGELGARYHDGTKGKSFTQAYGPFLYFQTEIRRGMLRPDVGVGIDYITGNASIAQGAVSGHAFVGGIYPGLELYPLTTTKWQPFLEVHGIASWVYAALSPVVPASDEASLALSFGVQAGLGVDIRHSGGQRAFRVHASYSTATAKLAGQSGFQLGGYALSLGLAY